MWYSLNSQVERLDFMQIPEQDLDAVKKRLARAQGQLGGIIRMVEEGRECTDVLTQLAAAQAAISKAAFTLIASGISHCGSDEAGIADKAKLEKAFLSLS
jgi:DNA-binding FrmR family transcriptional regulator